MVGTMSEPRYCAAAAVLDGKLYVAGGGGGTPALAASCFACMPDPRALRTATLSTHVTTLR